MIAKPRQAAMEDIVKRALVYTVTNIGQLSKDELRTLDRAVRRGWLSKGKGGPCPIPKTVWAHPGFDFAADRAAQVKVMLGWIAIDAHNAGLRAALAGSKSLPPRCNKEEWLKGYAEGQQRRKAAA